MSLSAKLEKLKVYQRDRLLIPALWRAMIYRLPRIEFFYIVAETAEYVDTPPVPRNLDDWELVELTADNTGELTMPDERDFGEKTVRKFFSKGCRCLAIRHRGKLAAQSWFRTDVCRYRSLEEPLGNDEAYLFNARTQNEYRGHNLAGYLRYQVYLKLLEQNRTKLLSITEFDNTASYKFKRKLGARIVKSCMIIRVGSVERIFKRNADRLL